MLRSARPAARDLRRGRSSTSACTRRVLVVDDLHWADQGTIDLLRFLLRRIRITRSLVVGALRDDEIGADASAARRCSATSPARPTPTSTTLRPLSVAAIAALVERPSGRPRLAAPAHRRQPVLRGRDARPRRRARSRAPCATPSSPAPPVSTADAWDLLHLLACAPEAIPDHLLAPLGIGLPALRAARRRRAHPARTRAASRSATTCAAWRSPAPSRPAARWRSTGACSTRSSRRRTPTRPCWPTTRWAPATPTRTLAPRDRRRAGRGAVGRAHAGGGVLPDRARAGSARVGRRTRRSCSSCSPASTT